MGELIAGSPFSFFLLTNSPTHATIKTWIGDGTHNKKRHSQIKYRQSMKEEKIMSEPSAHIRDHQSLIELNNTLEYSADSILKILEQVDAYLKGVIEALKKQMKVAKR